jgi:SAM-dependent methyltransferase
MTSGEECDEGERRSSFYRHSGRLLGASRLSLIARRSIYERFLTAIAPDPGDRILDVGVTSDESFQESNFLERAYPFKAQLTCVGTEDARHLEARYPGLRFTRIAAGDPLPFPTGHFDVVYSNAVVEHVGDAEGQRRFIAEALRVAKRFFIVTPNRLFPVETHTGLPLLHYLPPRMFRALLRPTPLSIWASEERLNLLTSSSFARAFPPDAHARVEYAGVGVGCFKSNLIASGRSPYREPQALL